MTKILHWCLYKKHSVLFQHEKDFLCFWRFTWEHFFCITAIALCAVLCSLCVKFGFCILRSTETCSAGLGVVNLLFSSLSSSWVKERCLQRFKCCVCMKPELGSAVFDTCLVNHLWTLHTESPHSAVSCMLMCHNCFSGRTFWFRPFLNPNLCQLFVQHNKGPNYLWLTCWFCFSVSHHFNMINDFTQLWVVHCIPWAYNWSHAPLPFAEPLDVRTCVGCFPCKKASSGWWMLLLDGWVLCCYWCRLQIELDESFPPWRHSTWWGFPTANWTSASDVLFLLKYILPKQNVSLPWTQTWEPFIT